MISKGLPNDIKEFLKRELPDVEVAQRYFGIQSYPKLICSPLRKDEKPSFSLFMTEDRTVMFKDFATGESGDIYKLLSLKWGIGIADVYRRVYTEFTSGVTDLTFKSTVLQDSPNIYEKSRCRLQVKLRPWKKYDLEYWSSYGVSLSSLRKAEVYPVSHTIYVSETGARYAFKCEKYAYVYVERRGDDIYLKVYQPFSKTNKWRSSTDSSVWNLETKIPKNGETVILTSSLKDSLNLWENTGIPAVCMQGEGYLPKRYKIEDLQRRYRNVIVFFDNDKDNPDNPGKAFAEKITEEFGIPHILIPDEYGAKDPSDLYKKVGKEKYLEIVNSLLNPVIDWEI